MKLLALVTDGFGASGGIARYNSDLMAALSASTFISDVLVLPRFGCVDGRLPDRVFQFEPIANAYLWAAKAASLAPSRRIDAIYCGHLNAAPFAARLARLTVKPLWIQVHGVEAWQDRGEKFRRSISNARLVTSVSRYTRHRLLSWCDLDPCRVRVLPNTFDSTFAPVPRRADLVARYGLENRKVILTVGRLAASESYKGHDRIIQYLPDMKAVVPEIIYLIVGTGDDKPRLEALAHRHGVSDAVIFAGGVATNELRDHYALADLFVMPSTGEGFGIVFLEAAAAGLPIIGGDCDGSRDALADGAIGRLVCASNPAALINSITEALGDVTRTTNNTVGRFAFQNFESLVNEIVRDFHA